MASEKRQPADPIGEPYADELSRAAPDPERAVAPSESGTPARGDRTSNAETGLARLIALAPQSDFFTLVAKLEHSTPDAVRVGGDGPVSQEAIRFRHDPSMAFSTSDVSAAKTAEKAQTPGDPLSPQRSVTELMTTFLGLTGSASPLPLYLASEIAQSEVEESIGRGFLDIFHHRILSLFYRLWIRYHLAWEYRADRADRWAQRLLSIGGLDQAEQPVLRRIPVWKVLRVAALLVGTTRSAHTLRVFLQECLSEVLDGAKVAIVQMTGGWTPIAEDQLMSLGRKNCLLGRNALLGSRIYDPRDRFRIRIGPLGSNGYRRMTFEKQWLAVLREAVELVVREPIDYEVELVLAPEAQPGFRLSARQSASLGRDTWLSGKEASRSIRIPASEIEG
jgi:type VI secretion system protein ImpH